MTPLTSCPYHIPGAECGKARNCPLYLFGEYVTCTALDEKQIQMVRSWVAGKALTREES